MKVKGLGCRVGGNLRSASVAYLRICKQNHKILRCRNWGSSLQSQKAGRSAESCLVIPTYQFLKAARPGAHLGGLEAGGRGNLATRAETTNLGSVEELFVTWLIRGNP